MKNYLEKRYKITKDFLDKYIPAKSKILDLGVSNELSERMKSFGYQVDNTKANIDLDIEWNEVKVGDYDAITAFEIFEHLICPFNLLREIKAKRLVASVPLNVWFSSAHWSKKEYWDCHYHEFEARQFDRLLEKAGWKIIESQKFKTHHSFLGIRPILRRIFPSYYIVYCERITKN